MNYQLPKLYIGPVSKNIVDAVIEYSTEHHTPLGLIPSRRQIDYDGGYVNYWTTKTFANYVKSAGAPVLLQRDHGGPCQGRNKDDGEKSFIVDNECLDIIHIDPWKSGMSFKNNVRETIYWLNRLDNPKIQFEIGTEQAIQTLTIDEIESMIHRISKSVPCRVWSRILYLIIQSGTALLENKQVGSYDESRLLQFIEKANRNLFYTKEHNGDYLSSKDIKHKFSKGLTSINIAPEFGMIETRCYIDEIKQSDPKLLDVLYQLCFDSKTWVKWVDDSFDVNDKERLILICCHYLFSEPNFNKLVRWNLKTLDEQIKSKIKERIHEIVN